MKQAFQRCRELTWGIDTAKGINYKYEQTLDLPSAKVTKVPEKWLAGFKITDRLSDCPPGWFYQGIKETFAEKGIAFYEPLQIWHIPELHNLFVSKMQREPIPAVHSQAMKILRHLTGTMLQWLPAKLKNNIVAVIRKACKIMQL